MSPDNDHAEFFVTEFDHLAYSFLQVWSSPELLFSRSMYHFRKSLLNLLDDVDIATSIRVQATNAIPD
ncbi:hypothetical protein BpHYR1_038666 [Brachionus plicatilis]|uniref:Uncharacterized protein n=1 Tax=Brachionus plicatilis TaxID=10195 RepID=A0A3M7RC45_BRAPC|nr:hypothetical protein BpHYR1_038666 [Brachionus plicatilis]